MCGGVFHHHPRGPSLSLRSGFAHPPDLEPQSDGCVPSLGKRAIKSFISDSGSPRRALSSLEDKRGFSLEPTPKVQRSWGWEGSPESLSRAGFPPPPPPPGVPVATERQVNNVQNKRGRAVFLPLSHGRKRRWRTRRLASVPGFALGRGGVWVWGAARQPPRGEQRGRPCGRPEDEEPGRRREGRRGRPPEGLRGDSDCFAPLGRWPRGSKKRSRASRPEASLYDSVTIEMFMPTSYTRKRNRSKTVAWRE